MVRNTSMKEIIISLQDNYKDIIRTRLEYNSAVKANKKSFIQKYQVHLKNLLKKRYNLYSELKAKLGGFALEVSYEYSKHTTTNYKKETAHFINLSEEEAKEVLTLGLLQKGYKVKIKEIKKIPTFLSKGKL